MSADASAIARLIDRLDHPDAIHQDQILSRLSAIAGEAFPVVLANFELANPRVRRALLRWLQDHLSGEATLPLMRYVFDETSNIQEETGRAMAMSLLLARARSSERPEEIGRLRAFAEDIAFDRNPEVRRLAARILAFSGNQRSLSIVEELANDPDEDVRSAARAALPALEEAPFDSGASSISAEELFRALQQSAGPRRRQLVRQWRRHPEAAPIALDLLRARSELQAEALQILLKNPLPEARSFLAPLALKDPDGGIAPLALRLMAALASPGEARQDEVDAIRRSLHSLSSLSRAAGCEAVAAFQLPLFIPDLLKMVLLPEIAIALPAAKALDELGRLAPESALHPLLQAVELNERRRSARRDEKDLIHLVAHLQSAIQKIVTPQTLGVESIHRLAINQLQRGGRQDPIRITAIQMLLSSTPEEGYAEEDRFSPAAAAVLLEVLPLVEPKSARRIAALLLRVAPAGLPGLDGALRRIWRSGAVDLEETLIPLLARSGSPEAMEMLKTLSTVEDPGVAEAARAILRKDRNQRDFIDAEFLPRDTGKS